MIGSLKNKIKKKKEIGKMVRIYEKTPTIPFGAVGMVIERSADPGQKTDYLVKTVEGFSADLDVDGLPKPNINPGKWITLDNMEFIEYTKPNNSKILKYGILLLTFLIGYGLCKIENYMVEF